MLREHWTTMQQCDDNRGKILQLSLPRPFGQGLQTLFPLLASPMAQNRFLDLYRYQFPDTPPSSLSLIVPLCPQQAANALAGAPFDQQSIKELSVQPKFGQWRVTTCAQGIKIKQALQPFYHNFHLPSYPIQLQHNFCWKVFRWQGCHHQNKTGKEECFGLRLSFVPLAFLAQTLACFLRLTIIQTISVQPDIDFYITGSRFDSRIERLYCFFQLTTQFFVQIYPSSFSIIKRKIVRTHPRNNLHSALLSGHDLIGIGKASICYHDISYKKRKLQQAFTCFVIGYFDFDQSQSYQIDADVIPIIVTSRPRRLHRASIANQPAPTLRQIGCLRHQFFEQSLDPPLADKQSSFDRFVTKLLAPTQSKTAADFSQTLIQTAVRQYQAHQFCGRLDLACTDKGFALVCQFKQVWWQIFQQCFKFRIGLFSIGNRKWLLHRSTPCERFENRCRMLLLVNVFNILRPYPGAYGVKPLGTGLHLPSPERTQ